MFKGPRKIVRDNKSSSYLVFELTGVNCIYMYIYIYIDKTINEAKDKIDQTDSILKVKLEKVEYEEIQKAIGSNETATKKILRQRNFE